MGVTVGALLWTGRSMATHGVWLRQDTQYGWEIDGRVKWAYTEKA